MKKLVIALALALAIGSTSVNAANKNNSGNGKKQNATTIVINSNVAKDNPREHSSMNSNTYKINPQPAGHKAKAHRPEIGSRVHSLPKGAKRVYRDNVLYYEYDGVLYQAIASALANIVYQAIAYSY